MLCSRNKCFLVLKCLCKLLGYAKIEQQVSQVKAMINSCQTWYPRIDSSAQYFCAELLRGQGCSSWNCSSSFAKTSLVVGKCMHCTIPWIEQRGGRLRYLNIVINIAIFILTSSRLLSILLQRGQHWSASQLNLSKPSVSYILEYRK